MRLSKEKEMLCTAKELSGVLSYCPSTVNTILCRPEFEKYRKRRGGNNDRPLYWYILCEGLKKTFREYVTKRQVNCAKRWADNGRTN